MHCCPAKVLVQPGCTFQVSLNEQALCKWTDLNKRQLSCINPRPGVLSEQAGDNPRHLAFERPPREYARGEGGGKVYKSSLKWNLTKFKTVLKCLGQQPWKSFFLVIRCWNTLFYLKDGNRFLKQHALHTSKFSSKYNLENKMLLTMGSEWRCQGKMQYLQSLHLDVAKPLIKSQNNCAIQTDDMQIWRAQTQLSIVKSTAISPLTTRGLSEIRQLIKLQYNHASNISSAFPPPEFMFSINHFKEIR